MTRMSAKDFPQELLELYDFYAHGRITKRQFLDRAGKFAVGGVTALALNLPGAAPVPQRDTPVAGPSSPQQHTDVVPPVVRTITVGNNTALVRPGGTP